MVSPDAISTTGKDKRRIEHATEAIRSMSQDLADEVTPTPTWANLISASARGAPVQALAIAFLLGLIAARW